MADVSADRDVTRGLGPDENPGRISFVACDIFTHPLHYQTDVFCGIVPGLAGAALHVNFDHPVFHGPQPYVVVEDLAIGAALPLVAWSAGRVDQHGTRT